MKKYDDKDIIKKFSDAKDYEIKTRSDAILNNFLKLKEAQTNKVEEKKTPKNRKMFIFGGLGVGSIALAAASITLAIVFVSEPNNPNSPNNPSDPVIPPSLVSVENNTLASEFLTFSNFRDYGTLQNNVKNLININRKHQVKNINSNSFEIIVDNYDSIHDGIYNILNKDELFKIEEKAQNNQELYGKTYKFVDRYYSSSDNFTNSFMEFYYDDINRIDEEETSAKGLMKLDEEYFDCYLNKESEAEENESELELELFLIDKETEEMVVVNKESEYGGHESEDSYSIAYYQSQNDYRRDEDKFIYKLSYEIEKEGREEELEIQVETQSSQCEYQNIKLINDDPLTYSFLVEYEDERNDIEVEDFEVVLKYVDGKRYYTGGDLEEVRI